MAKNAKKEIVKVMNQWIKGNYYCTQSMKILKDPDQQYRDI